MATAEVSQTDVTFISDSASDSQVSQSDVTVVYNIPSEEVRVSQSDTLYVADLESNVQVSQADVIVVMRGRVDDPAVRAWTFTLDGHDFYVLRLGNDSTLVYDMTTETWYDWASGDTSLWNVYNGINWVGGNRFASLFGSNILVGSDANGALFFLDPNYAVDDTAVDGRDPVPFTRRVTAQIPVRGYNRSSVYEVQLLGSSGQMSDETLNTVTLSYSDDRGDNYVSAGTVTTVEGEYDLRTTWRSLGSFQSPGRIFRLEDDGALTRIDSLTMDSDLGNGS